MKKYSEIIPDGYREKIANRSRVRYWKGYFIRLLQHLKYATIRAVARKNGAQIGEGSIIKLRLARHCNSNLVVGNDSIVEATDLDLRGKIIIGNHCIVNGKVEILRVSHYIEDDRKFTTKYYPPLVVGDYCWLATGCKILPSCCNIAENTVIGAYSVCTKDTLANSVYSGFPATKLKDKNCRFDNLLVCSLMGGDFDYYKKVR